MTTCHTCELVARRDTGSAPLWDHILRTSGWDLVHCYGTSLEGWLVLALRRHASCLAELTEAEAQELGPLIRSVSRALSEVVACTKTYAVQFAESPEHQHVHVHLIPRAAELPPELKGPGIFALLGLPPEQCVTDARMDAIARAVQERLA